MYEIMCANDVCHDRQAELLSTAESIRRERAARSGKTLREKIAAAYHAVTRRVEPAPYRPSIPAHE